MEQNKRLDLVRVLKSKTLEGKISWEETARQGTFLAGFPAYTVSISAGNSRDPYSYLLKIRNDDGDQVDELTDKSLPGSKQELEILYQAARHQALSDNGVDQAIDSILAYLR